MNHKVYLGAKASLTAVCILLFVLQSYRELGKYFSRMTSVAIKTEAVEDLRYPSIVICLEEPFKSARYPKTLEEFSNVTYSADEIIFPHDYWPTVEEGLELSEIATFRFGKCYLWEVAKNWTYSRWIGMKLRSRKRVQMHFLEKGQHLCITYGYCNEQYDSITLEKDFYEVYISATKNVRPPE